MNKTWEDIKKMLTKWLEQGVISKEMLLNIFLLLDSYIEDGIPCPEKTSVIYFKNGTVLFHVPLSDGFVAMHFEGDLGRMAVAGFTYDGDFVVVEAPASDRFVADSVYSK